MDESTRASRLRLAFVFVGVNSLMYWVGLVGGALMGGTLGVDLGVFHAAGDLIRTEGFATAYDPDRFSAHFEANYFEALADGDHVSHFISPPPFGVVAQALSLVPFDILLGGWFVAGLVAIVAATRWMRLPLWTSAVIVLLPPMAANTALGQTGPLLLALMAAMLVAASADRRILLGLLGGLLVLKPTAAIGFAIWWLFDTRRYAPAIAGALTSAALLTVPTLIDGGSAWTGFVDSTRNRAELEGNWRQFSPSLPEFLKLAMPGSSSIVTVGFWLAGLALGVGVVVFALRRWRDDAEIMFGAAVLATVLASPHLLTYDTMILVIPVAVAWHRGWLDVPRIAMLAALHVGSIALAGLVYSPQLSITRTMFGSGRGIGIEFPALVCVCWLLWRWSNDPAALRADSAPERVEVGAVT